MPLGVAATPVSVSLRLAGVKHLGRLDQVLAASEVMPESVFDRIMLDSDGHLVCGTRSNLFLRFGETLRTPSVDRAGVAGVMRGRILAGDFADALGSVERIEAVDMGVDALASAGITVAGRRLANRSISFLSFSNPASGRCWRSTLSHFGPPTAPNSTASTLIALASVSSVSDVPWVS